MQTAPAPPLTILPTRRWNFARLCRVALSRPLATLCLVIIAVIAVAAITGPQLAPDPLEFQLDHRLESPGPGQWLGTDDRGRDVSSRVLHGLRTSIEVGLFSAALGVTFGLCIGLLSGYIGGWFDALSGWMINSFLAFPPLLLAMAASLALGRSVTTLSIALALISWPAVARVLRASTLSQARSGYVESAVVVGVPGYRILIFHIFPNVASIFIVLLTAVIAQNILVEAALSFLGLGVRPPQPSLGSMVLDSQRWSEQAPWLILAPGATIAICVFAFSLFGDAMRDVLDPRLKH